MDMRTYRAAGQPKKLNFQKASHIRCHTLLVSPHVQPVLPEIQHPLVPAKLAQTVEFLPRFPPYYVPRAVTVQGSQKAVHSAPH